MALYACICPQCRLPTEWCDKRTPCEACNNPMHPECGFEVDGKRCCSICQHGNIRTTRRSKQQPPNRPQKPSFEQMKARANEESSEDEILQNSGLQLCRKKAPTSSNSQPSQSKEKATEKPNNAPKSKQSKKRQAKGAPTTTQAAQKSKKPTTEHGHEDKNTASLTGGWCLVGKEKCELYQSFARLGMKAPPLDQQHRCPGCHGIIHNLCGIIDESGGAGLHNPTWCKDCHHKKAKPAAAEGPPGILAGADKPPPEVVQEQSKKKKKKKQGKNLVETPKEAPVDPLIGTRVAFNLDGPNGTVLGDAEALMQLRNFAKDVKGKLYLLGTISKRANKSTKTRTMYTITWDHTRVGTTDMDANHLHGQNGAIGLAHKLEGGPKSGQHPGTERYPLTPESVAFLERPPDSTEYDDNSPAAALSSDDEGMPGDVMEAGAGRPVQVVPPDLPETFVFQSLAQGSEATTDVDGLEWEFRGVVDTPTTFASGKKTKLNSIGKNEFTTPLNAMLAFFPIELWKLFVERTNEYAKWALAAKARNDPNVRFPDWSGDTNLGEMMMFVSILLQMTLDPQPGRPFDRQWEYTEMSLRRFKQLRAALSVSRKGAAEEKSEDALFKVRPLLNTLKNRLDAYLEPGTDLAVDESSVACRSKYGRNMIFFNNTKPAGKYHFRFYLLCEADYYNCLRLVVATKCGCDTADGFVDPSYDSDDEVDDQDSISDDSEDLAFGEKQNYNKTTKLVLDLCRTLRRKGRVINTDNYYTSPQVAIALKSHGIFMRGTCRTSRKMFPQSVIWESS